VQLPTPDQLNAYLHAALYRFDCPSPLTIGDYTLDYLRDPDRRELAEHMLGCAECADELRRLREFLNSDPPAASPHPWRQVVAALLPRVSAFAPSPARGSAGEASSEYHAGPVHVVLGTLPARRRGMLALDGLVLHDAAPGEAAERTVTLHSEELPVQTTRTDDLGNFAFDTVAAGTYRLEIAFADEVVVIQNVTLAVRV
jgi:hypothetical protein